MYRDLIEKNSFNKIQVKFREPVILPKTIPLHTVEVFLSTIYKRQKNAKTIYQQKNALRDAAVIEMLFATGMRISELCSLQVSDVNLYEHTVLIYGKGAKERMIQLGSDAVIRILREYQAVFHEQICMCGHFFANQNGHSRYEEFEPEAWPDERIRWQIAKEQQLADELEADAAGQLFDDDGDESGEEQPERKLLRRELQAQALARLEDAARTSKDFENVIAWWDRLDANRERRERYHELSRSGDDLPLDYGASEDALCFPDTLNNVLEKQLLKGDFIDVIFNCPYEIHQLMAEEYMSDILLDLSEDHKFLLFLCALRQYSSAKIASVRGQTDRNIRKVRGTMLKKIRKELLAALTEKVKKQQSLTLLEKEFLTDNGVDIEKKRKINIIVI